MKKQTVNILAVAAIAISLWQCANPGTPNGGPKDTKPPVLAKSTPEPNAVGFTGKKVILEFNENIQLKDASSKFVMSPPPISQPTVSAHANIVTVEFKEDLQPSTTYTLDFADCISDNNEGNILDNYAFTFSTGESTDSMMISGNMYEASTLTPISGMFVLLYKNLEDSAFTTTVPIRIAKTDTEGRFAIKNIPADTEYRIYGLDDSNRNFIFDQPGEKIAWLGNIVKPSFEHRTVTDTILPNNTEQQKNEKVTSSHSHSDSIVTDTTYITRDTLVYTPDSLQMFAFVEDVYTQYITSDERKQRNVLNITFNKPMKKRPTITFPSHSPDSTYCITQYSANNDSCTIWLTDSALYKPDSVLIAIKYPVLDSLKNMVDKTDTLSLWHFTIKEKPKKRKKGDKPEPKPTLKLSVSQNVNVYAPLSLTAPTPTYNVDWDKIKMYQKIDTIYNAVSFTHEHDTIDICRHTMSNKWEPGCEYKLEIDSAAITDCYGLSCDAVSAKFKVKPLDSYGTLYLNIANAPANGLAQIVTTNDIVVRQAYIPQNGKVGFRYIKPGDYMIRVVADENRNGRWDTGCYETKIQPENISYYMEKVTIRANWEIKVDFDNAEFDTAKYAQKFKLKRKTGKTQNKK